ncbi:MAG: hypothetical protein QNJ32_14410 [Xenococcaceae cyanobacterium MO_167.B27]|nr:hypothetical protein [Xenococcaceae cyanobacterium MO_167.B27]
MTTVPTSLNKNQLPDGLKTPALFQLINWIARPFEYLEECTEKYGDIFTMRLFGFPPLVFIANPQGIKQIFSADAQCFDVGRTNDLARPILGDNSICNPSEDSRPYSVELAGNELRQGLSVYTLDTESL